MTYEGDVRYVFIETAIKGIISIHGEEGPYCNCARMRGQEHKKH